MNETELMVKCCEFNKLARRISRETQGTLPSPPVICDYQNGHYTYFDRNGEIIGEDIA